MVKDPSQLLMAYNEAWDRYEARCLWNVRRFDQPDAYAVWDVARRLRQHGDVVARVLAERLEELAGPEPYTPPL